MSAIVSGLIGGAISVVLTTYIAKRVGKASEHGSLRFGAFMWGLGVACLAMALLPVVMTLLGDENEFWPKFLLFIGFGVGAAYCFGEAAFVRGTYDADGIFFSTPWTGQKNERWKDLQAVRLNDWGGWYTLTFKSGKKIRLSRLLDGHLSALEMTQGKNEL
jgi:hypothetical protein